MKLKVPIGTVVDGYSYAMPLAHRIDKRAQVFSILVDMAYVDASFSPARLTYLFMTSEVDGSVVSVVLDNSSMQASVTGTGKGLPVSALRRLDESAFTPIRVEEIRIDIHDALSVARSSGLLPKKPSKNTQVDFRLTATQGELFWLVTTDVWDAERGSFRQTKIDAGP